MSLMSHPIKIARLLTIYMIFMSNVNILATNMDIVLIYSNTIDIICIIIKKSQYLSRHLKCTFFIKTNNCVTVVASAGLHFRSFYLLTFAASHDLKETIDKDYCECGMPLETVRESEAPLKERSERV